MEEERMSDVRLIERWLPIAELGIESVRERGMSTALPPINFLHVWWARRPLLAARAAIVASVLPADTDHSLFLSALGVNGNPLQAKQRLQKERRNGAKGDTPAFDYPRAFTVLAGEAYRKIDPEKNYLRNVKVLDPTAGGGSIPFEVMRLGAHAIANDLNPVAATILKATVELPGRFGQVLLDDFKKIYSEFRKRAEPKFEDLYASEPSDVKIEGYLWARTVQCPYCTGEIPLSPNWVLTPDGVGVKLHPRKVHTHGAVGRFCDFEVVRSLAEQSQGTVSGGDAVCPFEDCGRIVDGETIKQQAQAGEMGDRLFAVVFKKRVKKRTKSGTIRESWERDYRGPTGADDNRSYLKEMIESRLEDWLAADIIPSEAYPENSNDSRPIQYGMPLWRNLFSDRQLLGHCLAVETFSEMLSDDLKHGALTERRKAAYLYLSFAFSKLLNWNARLSSWNVKASTMRSVFDRHDFAFKWSYAEMPFFVTGGGFDWAGGQIEDSLKGILKLLPPAGDLLEAEGVGQVTISCGDGGHLTAIADNSVDAVVMDPPYGANVMYAELSDFFYVWLKRTAGLIYPELYTRRLTDKEAEAVANKALFKGQKGADALANRDYQEKMASIFAECRRVLKPNGIMTVMFTHKDTSAWDALTKGLIEAGFIITASWPVNTEAEGSLHIKDKAAANSTIFLVCRPRPADQGEETTYWEDVEPLVAKAVRTRVEEFQKAGIGGVDLYLASFGPALEEFSRHWPLKRGTPRPEPMAKKRRKQAELFEEEFDPYAVTPEDALDAARREVKTWRLNQLTHTKGRGDLDATTSWFVLAWDAFKAPVFSYDEGLRLARAVGADLEGQLIGKICEKKGSDIKLWDSAARAAKSGLGPADGSRAMIDAIHHAAHRGRTRTLDAALDLLKDAGIDNDPQFLAALEAVLEVLPPSRSFVGFDVATGDAKSAADDFDALEKLRRLAFSDRVDEPQQLLLFAEEAA